MIFSCSIACFKKHKESINNEEIISASQCEEEIKKNQKTAPKFFEDKVQEQLMMFETLDTLPVEKLQKLGESDELKELLKNTHLRNFLKEINTAIKPWNAMKLAMMEPLFIEFSDVCMKVLEQEDSY